MKKNLISIMILALMVVNVILTAIMMFSVMGTAKKTSALVTNIATVLNIELESKTEQESTAISIADTEVVDITDLTIPLKKNGEGKDYYCLVDVSLYMNKKHEDYDAYSTYVPSNLSLFKSIIIEVIGTYTIEEVQSNPQAIQDEILRRIQEKFGSTFIYSVSFSKIMYG